MDRVVGVGVERVGGVMWHGVVQCLGTQAQPNNQLIKQISYYI